ncbi:N-acetylmuramoyl-L-alanine amidase [Streptomyces sp. NPDC002668]|uniref:N-acetylmuramoyl-L-alanine amidase n=1 Tax=Streptomyces sp. NPDC002668 TaxID=3154422 RepID=UPI00331C730B
MAWYPAATRYELQPESDSQQAIRPTQFILHSIAAPWTAKRVYEYWRDSTNLESHFGLGYQGDLAQFIGTQTRADAQGPANLRSDGTGAVSLESASNLGATDPWTPEQLEQIILLGVWLHHEHGIPLRICRTADDPGYGYHRMHTAWNPNGHSCPGDARVKQFKDVVFPAIVARASGTAPQTSPEPAPAEDPMDFTSLACTKPVTIPAGQSTKVYWDAEYQDGADDHVAGGKVILSGNHYTGTASVSFAEDVPAAVFVRLVQEFTGGTSGEPAQELAAGARIHSASVTGRVAADRALTFQVQNNSDEDVTLTWAGLRLLTWAL